MSSNSQASTHFDPNNMIRQEWSIPESIIYYMAKNPSSVQVYEKLRGTCKYFFHTNPIIVVASLRYGETREKEVDIEQEDMEVEDDSDASDSEYGSDVEMYEYESADSDMSDYDGDMEDDDDIAIDDIQAMGVDDFIENLGIFGPKENNEEKQAWTACLKFNCVEDGCCKEIDLKTIPAKFWVTGELSIERFGEIPSELIPKLAKCEPKHLTFFDCQVNYDDLVNFGQMATSLMSTNATFKHDDGKAVFLEKIIDCLPKLCSLTYKFPDDGSSISSKTAISFFNKNEEFNQATLVSIPDMFDIESFGASIEKGRRYKYAMIFRDNISDDYKAKLDTFVDTVLYECPNFGLFIKYPGRNMEKFWLLRQRYFEKI